MIFPVAQYMRNMIGADIYDSADKRHAIEYALDTLINIKWVSHLLVPFPLFVTPISPQKIKKR